MTLDIVEAIILYAAVVSAAMWFAHRYEVALHASAPTGDGSLRGVRAVGGQGEDHGSVNTVTGEEYPS